MPIDVLSEIKLQEDNAQNIIQQAKTEARDMLKGVEAAVVDQERHALVDNRALLQEMLDSVRKDFQSTINFMFDEKKLEVEKEMNTYKANIPSAADYIVERVMQHGNS